MRGSHFLFHNLLSPFGIIPAHAGLTKVMTSKKPCSWDHPRACGAHKFDIKPLTDPLGSSPRMRGSRFLAFAFFAHLGIIPAHAGLTIERRVALSADRDHPRACGAHAASSPTVFQTLGSSPRMRGSLQVRQPGISPVGIIPAHAGLTSASCQSVRAGWDHPRACGAHCTCGY